MNACAGPCNLCATADGFETTILRSPTAVSTGSRPLSFTGVIDMHNQIQSKTLALVKRKEAAIAAEFTRLFVDENFEV